MISLISVRLSFSKFEITYAKQMAILRLLLTIYLVDLI
jgi:hypothetical protein